MIPTDCNRFVSWSHLISAMLFSVSAIHFNHTFTHSPGDDELVILFYIFANTTYFSLSTVYCLFSCHGEVILWECLDHISVVGIIWASSLSFTHFAFNDKDTRRAYISIISVSAIMSMFFVWASFDQAGSRWSRMVAHTALGILAATPAAHVSYGTHRHRPSSLPPEANLILLNSFGGLVAFAGTAGLMYALGQLQYLSEEVSHRSMHVMVVIGTWRYRQGLVSSYLLNRRSEGVR